MCWIHLSVFVRDCLGLLFFTVCVTKRTASVTSFGRTTVRLFTASSSSPLTAHFTPTLQKLKEFADYKIRLRALTIAPGNWSAVIDAKTKSSRPIVAPDDVIVKEKLSSSEILVQWSPLAYSKYWGPLRGYKVFYDDNPAKNDEHWNSKVR